MGKYDSPSNTLPLVQDHRLTLSHSLGPSAPMTVASERDRGRGSPVGGLREFSDKLEARLQERGAQPFCWNKDEIQLPIYMSTYLWTH